MQLLEELCSAIICAMQVRGGSGWLRLSWLFVVHFLMTIFAVLHGLASATSASASSILVRSEAS